MDLFSRFSDRSLACLLSSCSVFFFSILILTELRKKIFRFPFQLWERQTQIIAECEVVSLAPLAKTQVHKVLCSFHVFFSNKRLVDSQKTKIVAQFTENTHTWSESGKIPPFSHVQSIKFPIVKGKNRFWFLYQVVNSNKQISSPVRSRCLWKWPYVPLIYLDLFRRVIWIVHNISWLYTCTVQSTVRRLCTLCTERCFTVDW